MLEDIQKWLEENGYSIMHKSASNDWFNYIKEGKSSSIKLYKKGDEWVCVGCGFLGMTFNKVETIELKAMNNNIFLQIERIEAVLNWYDTQSIKDHPTTSTHNDHLTPHKQDPWSHQHQ